MQTLSSDLQARAAQIKLLILDVDGVLTDDHIFIRDDGEEIKSFNTLGGHGLKILQAGGMQTAMVTGCDTPSVGMRIQQLGIRYYSRDISDKHAAYAELRKQAGVEEHKCTYVSDDVVDLPVMVRCGLPVAVPNTHWFTLQRAAYVTRRRDGHSAVREVCDLIMRAKGTLGAALGECIKRGWDGAAASRFH